MSNHLPIRAKKDEDTGSWEFEWDEDALIYQAQVNDSVVQPYCCVEAYFWPCGHDAHVLT